MAAVAACAVAASTPARALPDAPSPRSMAMGDSLRAVATGSLGPWENPSGMSLVRNYGVEAVYGFDAQATGSTVEMAIVDSVTSKVAAGIYYGYVHSSPPFAYGSSTAPGGQATRAGHETGLALSLPLGDHVFFGVTSKYITIATLAPSPDPSKSPIHVDDTTNTAAADGFTMDTGVTVKLGDALSIAAVGYNLIPLHSLEAPMSLGTGLAYSTAALTAAFDVVVDFDRYHDAGKLDPMGTFVAGDSKTTVRLGGGLEYLAGGKVPIRLGAAYDGALGATYLTAGLGFFSPTFAADVALHQKVDGGVDSTIIAGVRLFLQ